jgi:hypothetical protein
MGMATDFPNAGPKWREVELTARCRLASTCGKAEECDHGKPHEPDCTCGDNSICYDHIPPERAWCEIMPPIVEV